jgi:23S rRNA-/tRNA-specific pseudouridylate synthase
LVIDKPPGIAHHSRRHDEDLVLSSDEAETGDAGTPGEASVSPGILALLRDQQAAGRIEYQGRLYGVHRLDQVTSGILVLAKDADMSRRLTQEFREGRVVKYYTGLSTHKAKKKQGWVKGRMVRGRRKSWYLTRNEVTNGGGVANLAVTRFFTSGLGAANEHLLVRPGNGDEPFTLPHLPPPRTLLLFRPYTGRTHQLRVAAKSVGLPLAGDPLYRDNGQDCGHRRPSPMAGRTYLHATALRVPEVGLVVISPPPFGHLWDSMGNELFRQQLSGLVQKHCDDEVISEVLLQHLGSTALDDG